MPRQSDDAQHRNDWIEWRKHILLELERQSKDIGEIDGKLAKLWEALNGVRTDLAMLKVKAGLWGALSGAASAIIATIIVLLNK